MSKNPKATAVLRVAAVWGTSVLAVRHLASGESLQIGEGDDALVPGPEGANVPKSPVRAVAGGWELDPKNATGGLLRLRGREEDVEPLAETGAPVPIVAGDHGLLQYGRFSIFFQFTEPVYLPARRVRIDWSLVSAFLVSAFGFGGAMFAMRQLTPEAAIEKPLELTSPEELMRRLSMPPEPTPAPDAGGGAQKKKDDQPSGDGKKMARQEGKLGKNGPVKTTKIQGAQPGLGGMAEALAGNVGQEVQDTLGSISSVAAALGGLNSDSLVLGQGSGTGLQGGGPGGGGDGPGGVPYGSGTLNTGFGAGQGKGGGGTGRGLGSGSGDGVGDGGERKLAMKDAETGGSGLSNAAIQRVIMSRYGSFRACYESAATRNPKLRGGVSVSFRISPSGGVSSASIASSTLANARVEGCMLRTFKRLRFPKSDKGKALATFPFSFKPSSR